MRRVTAGSLDASCDKLSSEAKKARVIPVSGGCPSGAYLRVGPKRSASISLRSDETCQKQFAERRLGTRAHMRDPLAGTKRGDAATIGTSATQGIAVEKSG